MDFLLRNSLKNNHNAPVKRVNVRAGALHQRLFLAVSYRFYSGRLYAQTYKEVLHRLCAAQAQFVVKVRTADGVGMALKADIALVAG